MASIKLIILSSFLYLSQIKADLYKEKEDFQYSKSSSDDGDQSGFFAAQRGNMGGNYEKSHNMDNWAQTQLKTLADQVGNQLGINGDMLHGGGSQLATYGRLHGSASASGGISSKGQTLGHEVYSHNLDQNAMTHNYDRTLGSQQGRYSQRNLDKSFSHEANYGEITRNQQLHSDFNHESNYRDKNSIVHHSNYDNNDQNIQNRVYPIRIIDRSSLVDPVVLNGYKNDYDITQTNHDSQNVARSLYDSTNSGYIYNRNGQKIQNNDKFVNIDLKPKEYHSSSSYKYEKEWETNSNSQTDKPVTPLNVKVPNRQYINNNDESLQMQDNYNSANLISKTAGTKSINTNILHDNSMRDQSYYDKEVQNIDHSSNIAQSQYDSTNSGYYYDSNGMLKLNNANLLKNAYSPKVHHSSSSYKYEKEWESHGQPQAGKSNLVMVPLSRDVMISNNQYINNQDSLQRNQIHSESIGKESSNTADILSKTDTGIDANIFGTNKDYANMNLHTLKPTYKQSSYSYTKSWENHGSSVAKPNGLSINPNYDHERLETFGENNLNEKTNNRFQGQNTYTANAHDYSQNMQELHTDLEQSLSKSLDNICDRSCNDRKNSYQANYAYSAQKTYNSESATRAKRSYNNIPHLDYPTLDSREEWQTDNEGQKTENLDQQVDNFDYDQQIENDFTDQKSEDMGQQPLDYDSNKIFTREDTLYYKKASDNSNDDQRKKDESFYGQEIENLDQNIEEIGQEIEQKPSDYGQKSDDISQNQLHNEQINESFDQTPMSHKNEKSVEDLSGNMFHITRYPYHTNFNLNENKIPDVSQQQLAVQKVSINSNDYNFIASHRENNVLVTSHSFAIGKSNEFDQSNTNIYSNSNYNRQHAPTESDIDYIPIYLHRQNNSRPNNVQTIYVHKKNEQMDSNSDVSSHAFNHYKNNNKSSERTTVSENVSNFPIYLNSNGHTDSQSKYDAHEFNVQFSGEKPINSALGESKFLPNYEDKIERDDKVLITFGKEIENIQNSITLSPETNKYRYISSKNKTIFNSEINQIKSVTNNMSFFQENTDTVKESDNRTNHQLEPNNKSNDTRKIEQLSDNNKINNIIESIMKNIENQKKKINDIGFQSTERYKSVLYASSDKEPTPEISNISEKLEKEIIEKNINQQQFPNYNKNVIMNQSVEMPENIILTTTIRNIEKTADPVLSSTNESEHKFRNYVSDHKSRENILYSKPIENKNLDTDIPAIILWNDNLSQIPQQEDISNKKPIESQNKHNHNEKYEIDTKDEVYLKKNIDLPQRFEGQVPLSNINEKPENFEDLRQIIENQEAVNDPIDESDLQQSVLESDTSISRYSEDPFNQNNDVQEPKVEEKIINPRKFGSYNFDDVQIVEPYTTTTTEKPGFWKKIGNSFTGAKNTVKSWFS